MPTNRVDWQSIRDKTGSPGIGEPFLFVLPNAGRALLLSIMERLEWRATYRDYGYDYADWDELQAIVAATENGLFEMTQLAPLIAATQDIADSIKDLTSTVSGGSASSAAINGLAGILSLVDPRLAVLLQVLDSIETVLGGDFSVITPNNNDGGGLGIGIGEVGL